MTERSGWLNAVLDCRLPMSPQPTTVEPQLQRLTDVRAVVFDIYGTLLISGSGDVGSVDSKPHDQALQEAWTATKLPGPLPLQIADLHRRIERINQQRKSVHCPKPEVDIIEAWGQTLAAAGVDCPIQTVVQLACHYEARANQTWPMPGASDLIGQIRDAEIPLGIVSNAQIFTVPLVTNLVDSPNLETAGFDLDLCIFSNRYRQAKPGPRLFDALCESLTRRQILPQQAVYVGNDMLNDVWAASQAGLRTAWFAGDQRSCRDRSDDPRCRSLRPDVVLTKLVQLLQCIEIE
ncbi:MAG: HAD family hydrolase [Rubripirellula sp.]|jgi:putative hydrolase of the HAD superfamily|nr:HAD family hydrolase [Rubripirellula sp.]